MEAKLVEYSIEHQSVTVGNETCSFYEAGIYGEYDKSVIEEHLRERFCSLDENGNEIPNEVVCTDREELHDYEISIDGNYYGIINQEELSNKIYGYLEEFLAWDYDKNDWVGDDVQWTFSGWPNCHLTDFVIENASFDISFSDEDDRLAQCKKQADAIAEKILID